MKEEVIIVEKLPIPFDGGGKVYSLYKLLAGHLQAGSVLGLNCHNPNKAFKTSLGRRVARASA